VASAEAGVDRLVRGEHPLRLMAARNELEEMELEAARARRVWEMSVPLGREALLSEAEIGELKSRMDASERSVHTKQTQVRLLEEVILPAERGEAEAKRDAAKRRLDLLREQMEATTLTAGIDGMAMRLPLHIEGEYRTLREGDKVYRNQRFMQVADLSTLAARFEVPEDQISLIHDGDHARIVPASFPDQDLKAEVSGIAAVALSAPGNPAWRKTFQVTASLRETHPRLRSGMTVRVMVLTHADEEALLVPRSHVAWEGNRARVRLRTPGGDVWRDLDILAGNETHFSIGDSGLEGERIVNPFSP
jgi:HlyD family secretion protein